MKHEIIIPHLGLTPELTGKALRCLNSVREFSTDYRVILIDNGTTATEWQPIADMLDTMPHMLIRNSSNQGFVKATNQGLKFSTAPYVVLLNNDTVVPRGWIEKLRQPFDEESRVGIVGPLTDDGGWQGKYRERNPDACGWAPLMPGRMLAFFCAMMSRRVIDEVGYQDETFVPYGGFGGDDDYCRKVEQKGFMLALQRDLVVHHDRRSTFHTLMTEDESKAMQAEALAKFREMASK